ncbi:MAG TPA: hypothetical protein VLW55_20080 [Burkholderiaceae bacterium]|nr:hypothetical protein [Burkholderiaceae bacterium]
MARIAAVERRRRSDVAAQHAARPFLQCAVRALPSAIARRSARKLAHQRLERIGTRMQGDCARHRVVAGEGGHEFDLAVLADAEARLRTVEPPATDALPRLDSLGARCPSRGQHFVCSRSTAGCPRAGIAARPLRAIAPQQLRCQELATWKKIFVHKKSHKMLTKKVATCDDHSVEGGDA